MYGIVLEGGGAKGSYHIGAYKAILELEIPVGLIAGTSIGAVNGAAMAQGDFDKAYELWWNIKNSMVFDVEDQHIEKWKNLSIDMETLDYIASKLKDIIGKGGLDTSVMRALLENIIDEQKLRNSDIDFALVTVSLSDMKPVEVYKDDIPAGEIISYILASASFPGFKSEPVGGKLFVDGGVYNNLPINLAYQKGYKDIISIRTHGLGREKKNVLPKGVKNIIIEPREELGRTLDFDEDVARYNIQLGYYDAMKALKNLFGKKYYIDQIFDEKYFLSKLMNIDGSIIEIIKSKMGEKDELPAKRFLFESMIPKIIKMLELEENTTYEELVLSLYEVLAQKYEIKRFEIYDARDFMEMIEKEYKKRIGDTKKKQKQSLIPGTWLWGEQKKKLLEEIAALIIDSADFLVNNN